MDAANPHQKTVILQTVDSQERVQWKIYDLPASVMLEK